MVLSLLSQMPPTSKPSKPSTLEESLVKLVDIMDKFNTHLATQNMKLELASQTLDVSKEVSEQVQPVVATDGKCLEHKKRTYREFDDVAKTAIFLVLANVVLRRAGDNFCALFTGEELEALLENHCTINVLNMC
ncbi:hypothetical protein Tco_0422254 [Tanacetum coccineum]